MRDCQIARQDLGPAAADPDARGPGRGRLPDVAVDRDRLIDPLFRDGSSRPSWPRCSGCTCRSRPTCRPARSTSSPLRALSQQRRSDAASADAAARDAMRPGSGGGSGAAVGIRTACSGRRGRTRRRAQERDSGFIEPSSFSSAYSTSDFHDSAVRSSSRSRGIARVRPDRLEARPREEVGRRQAARLVADLVDLAELRVAERLDRLHAALRHVARHALDEHPAQPAAGERRHDVGRHQQHRVGRDRATSGTPWTAARRPAARTSRSRPASRRRR